MRGHSYNPFPNLFCFAKWNAEFIPIFIGYEDDWKDPNIRQTVTFESCVFEEIDLGNALAAKDISYANDYDLPNNDVIGPINGSNDPNNGNTYAKRYANYTDFSTLILATGPANTVVVRDCVFRNGNDNQDEDVPELQSPGYLVTSLGAQMVIERSCFTVGSSKLGTGGGPVLVGLGNNGMPALVTRDNHVDGNVGCNFVSEMLPDGSPPSCNINVTASATVCQSTMKDFWIFW